MNAFSFSVVQKKMKGEIEWNTYIKEEEVLQL